VLPMNITPLGERVLIKLRKEERTKGGIYLPESVKDEKKEGEVVSAGQHSNGTALPLRKGDKVIFGGYSSDEVEINGEKHLFVDFKDILAKIELGD